MSTPSGLRSPDRRGKQIYAALLAHRHHPTMAGPQCCVPAPPSQHACTGKEEALGPFLSYVVQPPSPKAAVILVSDIFGFETPLLRKLADKVAAAGYTVVVPDFFNRDYFVPGVSLSDWLKKHEPVDVGDDTKTLIEVLKSKGLQSVGAVGFCWGAKVVVELAKEDCLKAAVFCHPSFVTIDDIKGVKTPLAILAAEIDERTPPALAKQFQEILESKKEIESFVNIYPGAFHGWTTRYDVNDENAVARAGEAHQKILEWLGKFLH